MDVSPNLGKVCVSFGVLSTCLSDQTLCRSVIYDHFHGLHVISIDFGSISHVTPKVIIATFGSVVSCVRT